MICIVLRPLVQRSSINAKRSKKSFLPTSPLVLLGADPWPRVHPAGSTLSRNHFYFSFHSSPSSGYECLFFIRFYSIFLFICLTINSRRSFTYILTRLPHFTIASCQIGYYDMRTKIVNSQNGHSLIIFLRTNVIIF